MHKLVITSLLAVLAYAQPATYPSSVVTDGKVGVAVNGINTTLAAGITPSATSFTVRSATGIAPNTFLTLSGVEIVKVCSVVGTTVQVGDASCPNIDGRGFDGTTASYHVANGTVMSYPIARNHNQLAAEVKAIETALGANLINVRASTPAINASDYNFAAQAPGGSLTASIINSVTLAPCPQGVNGTNTGHSLYISGGTGTAEWVIISGGTCTSGAASGTVFFTPANNHSGAWTIASGTSGITEALNILPAVGGVVAAPAGTLSACNVAIARRNQSLIGQGIEATILTCESPTLPAVHIYNGAWWGLVQDMKITRTAVPTAGGDGIVTDTNTTNFEARRVYLTHHYHGLRLGPTTYSHLTEVQVQNSVLDGFYFEPDGIDVVMQWQVKECGAGGNGRHGFFIDNTTSPISMIAPEMRHILTFANQGNGIRVEGQDGKGIYAFILEDLRAEADNLSGLYMKTFGNEHALRNMNVGGSGLNTLNVGYPTHLTTPTNAAYGIELDDRNDTGTCPSSTGALSIYGVKVVGNALSGVKIKSCGVLISGITAARNGVAQHADDDKRAGVTIQASEVTVMGGFYSSSGDGFGNAQQKYGIEVSGAAPIPTLNLAGNTCDVNTGFAAGTQCFKFNTVPTSYAASLPGFYYQRWGASCSTVASVAATCDTTLTLTQPFPDTNYVATCSLRGTITGVPTIVGYVNQAAGSIDIRIAALTAAAASASNVDCVFRHQ